MRKWNLIPEDTDVLITHSPPLGFGDLCSTGIRAGCVDLLQSVHERRLKEVQDMVKGRIVSEEQR